MFATEVNWLEKVYTSPSNLTDVGYVWRNEYAATLVESIRPLCPGNDYFIDYGAGYGLFVRMMRDRGFRFHWKDPYCENLFSRGFDFDLDRVGKYRMATAFEVFEHVPNPVETVQEIAKMADGLLFSTTLIPPGVSTIADWDYFGLEHGQHISFYSEDSLSRLAELTGWTYSKLSEGWHYFGEEDDPFPGAMKRLLESEWRRTLSVRILNRLGMSISRPRAVLPSSNRGLIQSDYRKLKGLWSSGKFSDAMNCDFEE